MSAVTSDEAMWALRETDLLLPNKKTRKTATNEGDGICDSDTNDINIDTLLSMKTILTTINEGDDDRYNSFRSKSSSSISNSRKLTKCVAIFSVLAAILVLAPDLFGGPTTHDDISDDETIILDDPWEEGDVPILGASNSGRATGDKEYTNDAQKDMITSLPGLHSSIDLGFNMFSGYLTVSEENGRNIFYWYVESQGNPSTDPVVFWTNGGPGCSGLIGFGQEHGPFHFSKDGVITLNPFSWNVVANMLYVEQPAGVGYSYSDTPKDMVDVGDDDAAVDNLIAIQRFFERFPERSSNDFYISSESYGGHYIPQLAKKIVDRIGTPGYDVPFRGFLVGNPWVDPFTNDVAQTRAFYQHGLISLPMINEWLSKCSDRATYDHKACPKAIRDMRRNMKNISPYALDYPVCTEDKIDLSDSASAQVMHFLNLTAKKYQYPRVHVNPRFLPRDVKYLPCAEQHFNVYLNQEVVQEALHVRGIPQRWHACAPSRDLSYSPTDFLESQIDLFKELIAVAKRGQLHLSMLVFSGDNDSVCSTSSTQAWIYDLGVDPLPKQDWLEWSVEEQTAGFVTRFDLGEKSHSYFIFATIHGAGHEAAAYRPIEALELFRKYLRDEL